ncbi:MAG: response regulator, partial [Nostocaceae cyanobacterium]|nr:response regulator [Nostocaceae cyanobacterium]
SLKDQLMYHLGSDYDIQIAETGVEALEICAELQANKIDIPLIISDQMMPGMNGDELLTQVHLLYPKTLKILLTGQASANVIGNAVNHANLYRYLTKPWNETDICLTVTEAIRCYFQEQQLAAQNTQLAELNLDLEQKIAERTAELTKINTRLQQEITERKLLEQKLSKSESQIRAVFEAMTDAILLIDEHDRIEVAPTNLDVLYTSDTGILNLTVEKFFAEEGEIWFSKVKLALETQQTVNFEYSLSVNDRSYWFTASISPLPNKSVIWVARDISDRKQVEAAMQQALIAADSANRAKSEFLTNMSHELRTPLNAILGFSQVLKNDNTLTPTQQEQLLIIRRSGEHLLKLINDVLEMSKIEAGKTTLNENNFDLICLLEEIAEVLRFKAESAGLQLIFDYPSDLPRYIRTDESKLRQVLLNLIVNAIKFTESGGVVVRVKGGCGEKTVSLLFEVEDTGVGIASEAMETLFEPFVQIESGKTQEGTGLGLPISRKFVQLMGGDISVRSVLGSGTICQFEIKVSLVEATAMSHCLPTQRVKALAPNQPTYRILVVDDRTESRQLIIHLLSPLGFAVRAAENGQQAIQEWESWEPHLIFMDMRMPVMDGYEATKYIKARLHGQATVVIAFTASAFDQERNLILSTGCDDFVIKPFREEVLLEKISTHLGAQYLYEDLPRTIPNHSVEELTPELVNVMPTPWLTQLQQAAECVDNEHLRQLITQIPAEYAFLAESLSEWVKNFRCDKIVELIEQAKQLKH